MTEYSGSSTSSGNCSGNMVSHIMYPGRVEVKTTNISGKPYVIFSGIAASGIRSTILVSGEGLSKFPSHTDVFPTSDDFISAVSQNFKIDVNNSPGSFFFINANLKSRDTVADFDKLFQDIDMSNI